MSAIPGVTRNLSLDSTAGEASLLLLATRARAVVVFDGEEPVGVITAADLAGPLGGVAVPDARVGDLLAHECVAIEPTATEEETLRRYSEAAWTSLRRRHPGSPEDQRRRERARPRPMLTRGEPGPESER